MEFHCIGSGSDGNSYILSNDNEALLIDCGCNLSEVKKALNFDVLKIAGVCISHEHL